MHERSTIHRLASKTYELSSRLMEYARIRTMDLRERTASPFNYLASYSISEARLVDASTTEARAINAEAATTSTSVIRGIFLCVTSISCV